MLESESKALESEVADIYTSINHYEESISTSLFEKPSFKHSQGRRILNRYILVPLSLFFLFSILALFLDSPLYLIKIAALLLMLILYVVVPTLQIMELYAERHEFIQFFRNSNKVIIEGFSETITSDCLLAQALKSKSIEALHLVKNRISAQQGSIVIRVGALVGAIDKVGIVPGLITLFIAASSKQNEPIAFIIAMVVFVLYIFAFTIHFSLPRFNFYTKLIESEIESRV